MDDPEWDNPDGGAASFNLFVNDAHVATVVDARFGFGEVYWEVSAYEEPAQVLLVRAAVHAIA